MTQINKQAIQEIAQKSKTAEAFFTYAACRVRNVRDGVSSVPAIKAQMTKEGFHPIPQDLLRMFRDLENAGVGEVKGNNFKWHLPIKAVGEMGSGPAAPKATPEPVKPQPTPASLYVILGEKKEMSVTYTPGLTRSDVQFVMDKLLQKCAS